MRPLLTRRRPIPVADRSRDGDLYEHMHPRLAAIRLLREKIADHQAGLDPYDRRTLIVDAREHERVWVHRCLELTGLVVGSTLNWQGSGGVRYRAIVEADVRAELDIDRFDAPVLRDEPLASRRGGGLEPIGATVALIRQGLTPISPPEVH